MTNTTALGRHGPDNVTGHVCPSCNAAIEAEKAIGQSAIAHAVIVYVALTSPKKALRLRSLLEDDLPPVLSGWGVLNRPPSREPCSHLVKVIDRL